MQKLTQMGPLQALHLDRAQEKTIVLLHGYGASASDLFGLHQVDQTKNFNWLFPEGPLEIPIGPGLAGKAWFPIDTMALEQAMSSGTFRSFQKSHMQGFQEAIDKLLAFFESLKIPQDQLYLGGFSQGAMIATELSLRNFHHVPKLTIFSGSFVDSAEWDQLASKNKKTSVFQSHGRSDPLLSFKEAERLHKMFTDNAMKSEFHPFDGGHEIPLEVLQKWVSFLSQENSKL